MAATVIYWHLVVVAMVLLGCTGSENPFMFLLRSAIRNPVTYVHSTLVNQLTALPCYLKTDGNNFAISNRTDMAWYRRHESAHNPRTFPSMSDSSGRMLVLEPIIGHNWFLCDTAYTSKLQHAKKYDKFYSEFNLGLLDMDWDYYQEFSEFDKGQFKHHLFSNELSITEIIIFLNVSLVMIKSESSLKVSELTEPLQMGVFKGTLLRILESECRDNVEHFCEKPTVDILIANWDTSSVVTLQGRVKLHLSNEKLLKLGPNYFAKNREDAMRRNILRWTMSSQSVNLGALATLNPYPLIFTLVVSAQAQNKSDCVGSGSYLSTKYDWQCVLCRPGYHLKNEPWIHAASEKNSICHLCPVGTYSNGWGGIDCHPCPGTHTTRKVGSTKHTDCLPLSRYAMEIRIKELLTYFGVDESDDYKKAALLAAILMAPWVAFIICLIISLAYGHNEVKDSESRFQLEKELGAIILRIRRNYNSLIDEQMRL